MKLWIIIVAQIFAVMSVILFDLAWNWIIDGGITTYAMHPFFAIPLGIAAWLAIPILVELDNKA